MKKGNKLNIGDMDPLEAGRVRCALFALAPSLTHHQIETVIWLTYLHSQGGLEDGRMFSLSCVDCATFEYFNHPIEVAHKITHYHRGCLTVVGISNPKSSHTVPADGSDLPADKTVLSITSWRGEK